MIYLALVCAFLLGWAIGIAEISKWARKEELSADDIYIEAYDKGFDNALQDASEAVRDGYADWNHAASQRKEITDTPGYIFKRLHSLQGKSRKLQGETLVGSGDRK